MMLRNSARFSKLSADDRYGGRGVALSLPLGKSLATVKRWLLAGAILICWSGDIRAQTSQSGPETLARPAVVARSALLRVIEQVAIPARTAGVLASVDVGEGDIVADGALLARVDDAEAKMIYGRSVIEHELSQQRAANELPRRSAEKALEFSRTEFTRLRRAAEELPGSISKSELEEAKLKAEQADLDLQQAKQDLRLHALTEKLKATERAMAYHSQKMHEIRAPVNGMVVELLRRRGEWVEPGENVLRIMRVDRLRAEGLVNAGEAIQGMKGALAEIKVQIPGQAEITAPGRVTFISPEINPVSGQVRVRAEFDNPGGRLMPGMRAEIVIHPQQRGEDSAKTALASPDSAAP